MSVYVVRTRKKRELAHLNEAAAIRHRDFLNKNYDEQYYVEHSHLHVSKNDIEDLEYLLQQAKRKLNEPE